MYQFEFIFYHRFGEDVPIIYLYESSDLNFLEALLGFIDALKECQSYGTIIQIQSIGVSIQLCTNLDGCCGFIQGFRIDAVNDRLLIKEYIDLSEYAELIKAHLISPCKQS